MHRSSSILRKSIKKRDDIVKVNDDIHMYFSLILNQNIQPKSSFYDIIRSALFKDDNIMYVESRKIFEYR